MNAEILLPGHDEGVRRDLEAFERSFGNTRFLDALKFATEVIPGSSLHYTDADERVPQLVLVGREHDVKEEPYPSNTLMSKLVDISTHSSEQTSLKFTLGQIVKVSSSTVSDVRRLFQSNGHTYMEEELGRYYSERNYLGGYIYPEEDKSDFGTLFAFIERSNLIPPEDMPEVLQSLKSREI